MDPVRFAWHSSLHFSILVLLPLQLPFSFQGIITSVSFHTISRRPNCSMRALVFLVKNACLQRVVMNPMPKTTSFVVVGDKPTVSVQSIIDAKKFNVVGYRWVLECIKRNRYEFPAMHHVSERGGVGRKGGRGIRSWENMLLWGRYGGVYSIRAIWRSVPDVTLIACGASSRGSM